MQKASISAARKSLQVPERQHPEVYANNAVNKSWEDLGDNSL